MLPYANNPSEANPSATLSSGEKLSKAVASFGARFSVSSGGERIERNLPFDPEPRIITADEFDFLERGLKQRVRALNLFLADVYGEGKILRDSVVPADFAISSGGFLPEVVGVCPPLGVYANIAGIDLVKGGGTWYVLEDNLRVPSGVSYPLTARKALEKLPLTEADMRSVGIEDSLYYKDMLSKMFSEVSRGGINALLTTGRSNCAYYEHTFLAEATGCALCEARDLFVDDDVLYFKGADKTERVGVLYTRVDGVYADPLAFGCSSCFGVPNLFAAYAAGNVAVVNAFGCGVADDKGLYGYVPRLIEYYLGEKAILQNAPTYLPTRGGDMAYIRDNFSSLVIKSVGDCGGHGVVFAGGLEKEKRRELLEKIESAPRNYIAQEMIDFETLPSLDGERKADLRAFVVSGKDVKVWKSGLTRYASAADEFIVNSSHGGGFKDTWVLSR